MTQIAIEFNGFHFGLVCFTLSQISVLTPHAGSFLSKMESQKVLESPHCIFFQGGATMQIAGCFLYNEQRSFSRASVGVGVNSDLCYIVG